MRKTFFLEISFFFSIIYVTMIYVCLRPAKEGKKRWNSVNRFRLSLFSFHFDVVVVAVSYRRLREIYVATLQCRFSCFSFHFSSLSLSLLPKTILTALEIPPCHVNSSSESGQKKFYCLILCEWKKAFNKRREHPIYARKLAKISFRFEE